VNSPYHITADHAFPALDERSRKRRFWGRMIWVGAIAFLALPVIGMLGTVIGMTGAFATLKNTGSADPSELAGNISVALLTTFWAIVASLPILIFLIISIIRYRRLGTPAPPPATGPLPI
jgi:biopolymer transport protein ExbB/TolQ